MADTCMPPANAVLAGTRDAAKLLGVDADVGTLQAGKVADVVAVAGDVLKNIRSTEHPVFVMHLGHVVLQKAGFCSGPGCPAGPSAPPGAAASH